MIRRSPLPLISVYVERNDFSIAHPLLSYKMGGERDIIKNVTFLQFLRICIGLVDYRAGQPFSQRSTIVYG